MNQLTASDASHPVTELEFMRDWSKSFSVVGEAAAAAPVASAIIAVCMMGNAMLGWLMIWPLIQSIAILFFTVHLIRKSFAQIVPETSQRPELFPVKPEWKMIGAAFLINLGTTMGIFFFIIPGIWFAMVHAMTQNIIVLEGTGILEAMARSRQIMNGNIMRIAPYCFFAPFGISIGAMGAVAIALGVCWFMAGAVLHGALEWKTAAPYISAVFTTVSLGLSFTFVPLMVRAYVYLMHLSGMRTNIEQEISTGASIGRQF